MCVHVALAQPLLLPLRVEVNRRARHHALLVDVQAHLDFAAARRPRRQPRHVELPNHVAARSFLEVAFNHEQRDVRLVVMYRGEDLAAHRGHRRVGRHQHIRAVAGHL
mmetsp:Transcript_23496/g.69821  ORF Transcript_23496/g.69821 Transcript_23496/m.69821 type:complete len:108 (+) Transcript_23496:590-913(+)